MDLLIRVRGVLVSVFTMLGKIVSITPALASFPILFLSQSAVALEASECLVAPMAVGETISASPISPTPLVEVASTSAEDIAAAVNEIIENNGGTLYFPKGSYTVDYLGANNTSLTLENLDEFKLVGDGRENTILKLEANDDAYGKQIRNIQIIGANRVEIADITIEGNREFYRPPEEAKYPIGEVQNLVNNEAEGPVVDRAFANKEQQSTLFLRNIAESTYIHDSTFHEAGGDGINVANSPNLVVQNNIFDNNDRNGITIGGIRGTERSENVLIENNFFGPGIDTQQIDLELHGPTSSTEDVNIRNSNVRVINNTFAQRLVEDTVDLDQYGMTISEVDRVILEHNHFNNNPLFGIYASNVRIYNNKGIGGLRFIRKWSSYDIAGNTFNLLPITRRHWPAEVNGGLLFQETAGEDFDTLVFRHNKITSTNVDWPIYLHGVNSGHLESNTFDVTGAKDTVRIESHTLLSSVNLIGNSFSESDVSLEYFGPGAIQLTSNFSDCPLTSSNEPAAATANEAPAPSAKAPAGAQVTKPRTPAIELKD